MSTNTGRQTPCQESNSTESHETSTTTQQTASQSTTENARQQVDQILEQTREGFSFESIAKSIFESIGNLWKALGITNLFDYIANFLGFGGSSDSTQTQQQEQAPETSSVPDRTYPLQSCDTIPQGGQLKFASSTIPLFMNNQCSESYQGHNLFKGERAIIMPNQPQNGSYKIKALGRGKEGKYLYIREADFTKLQDSHPGARTSRGMNAYLTGDSISQGLMPHTAFGDGMPNMSGLHVAKSVAGRLSQNPNDISQRRIAFVMGFNDLRSGTTFRSEAQIQNTYDQIFAILVNIKRNYGKTIALNGLYQWTDRGSTSPVPNEALVRSLNNYIREKCARFGFKFVDMTPFTDPAKGLHQANKNPGQFIDAMTS